MTSTFRAGERVIVISSGKSAIVEHHSVGGAYIRYEQSGAVRWVRTSNLRAATSKDKPQEPTIRLTVDVTRRELRSLAQLIPYTEADRQAPWCGPVNRLSAAAKSKIKR